MEFMPDFNNIIAAARNQRPSRMPLYEHSIGLGVIGKILNKDLLGLENGDRNDKRELIRNIVEFYRRMGYDTVSFECGISEILPGGGALGRHQPGVIKCREDFEKYPWEEVHDIFFNAYDETFQLLGELMPAGMKAMGGPGYGIFECVQDIVGYMDLCYISCDDPELYEDLFNKMGKTFMGIWSTFLKRHGDTFAVCRIGDDMGFRSSTLISAEDIRRLVVPQYKNVVELVHSYGKPFLLHSCGKIFDVMDDLIDIAKIDAKHSNEDAIAPFSEWVDRYGDRIGNFGGIDTDLLCRESGQVIKERVREVVNYSVNHGGFALGSGNSIPDYVPVEGYLAMVEEGRRLRGE